ncbi:hypothetical protein LGM76_26085 [Burkholderia cepacia]|nr:hypothetical protein [Burkholderia cepacia]MCA8401771.1 hypothetical protein [Burkholderia cepacia]
MLESNIGSFAHMLRQHGLQKAISAIVPVASAFGIICLTVYFGTLEFTPDISFAQGALVAVQAGLTGGVFLAVLIISLSVPAWVYYMLGIRPAELVSLRRRREAINHLVTRFFCTQALTISAVAACAYFPQRAESHAAICVGVAVIGFIWSCIFLVSCPRVWGVEALESRWTFFVSVVLGAFTTVSSLVTLNLLWASSPGHHSNFWFLITVFVVVILGGAQVAIGLRDVGAQLSISAMLVLEISLLLGPPVPRFIANAVGIAEKTPVDLLVGSELCNAIRTSAAAPQLRCEEKGPSLVKSVEVLNSLGSRWVIRIPASGKILIIPGKDLTVVRAN